LFVARSVVMAPDNAEDLRKLLESCDQMLDHYCAGGRSDDRVAQVMRESRRRLAERLESVEAAPAPRAGKTDPA